MTGEGVQVHRRRRVVGASTLGRLALLVVAAMPAVAAPLAAQDGSTVARHAHHAPVRPRKSTDVWCSSLRASWAGQISPATGEDAMPIQFTNTGGRCALKGYASIAMIDARKAVLPFRFSHRSQYFLSLIHI